MGGDGGPLSEEVFAAAISDLKVTLTPSNYLTGIALNYDYDFGQAVKDWQPYRWNVIFKEGENQSLTSSTNPITRKGIEEAGWQWEELCSVYKPGKFKDAEENDPRYTSGTYSIDDGIFFAGKKLVDNWEWEDSIYTGLKPNTKYSYYLAIAPDNDEDVDDEDFYIKTSALGFITTSGNVSSAVKLVEGDHFTTQYSDADRENLVVNGINVDNENGEFLLGFYLGGENEESLTHAGLIEAYEAGRFSQIWEPQATTEGGDYSASFSGDVNLDTYGHLYVAVFTGTEGEPTYTLINLGELGEPSVPEEPSISSNNVSVTYEPGISDIKAVITYEDPENRSDLDLNEYGVRITAKFGESSGEKHFFYSDEDEYESSFRWQDQGDGKYKAEIRLAWLWNGEYEEYVNIEPNTAYTLSANVGKWEYSEEENENVFVSYAELPEQNVTTLLDVQINKSEFDEKFLEFLINDCELEAVDGDTVSQSALDRITSIMTWIEATPITNLKGIGHLRNLEYVEINGNELTDISALAENKNVTHAEFMENKLKVLPDLRSTNLESLNLDYNYLPDSEVVKSKLPSTLAHSYEEWDEDEEEPYTVEVTLDDIVNDMKSTQHKTSDIIMKTQYLDEGSGEYPLEFAIKGGKLKPFIADKYDNNQAAFYIFEAYTEGNEPEDPSVSGDGVVKAGLFYNIKPHDDSKKYEENIQEMKEEFGLDEIYLENGELEQYDFNLKSVAGINSTGKHSVTYKLIKRNILKGGGGKQKDIVIFTDTVEVLYTKGEVTSLAVSPTSLSLNLGQSGKLTATVTVVPDSLDKSVIWSSDDDKVASVDGEGNVKALAVGSTVIRAVSKIDKTRTASCNVTVKDVKPQGITLRGEGGRDTLFVGKTLALEVTFTPADASVDASKVSYSSSDPLVASVSGNVVAGVKEGSARITASYTVSGSDALTSSLEVEVKRASQADKKFYTVKFTDEDGVTTLITKSVLEGQIVAEPALVPEKTGYQFIGWGQGGSVFNFTTPIAADLTLKALFKELKAEVDANSGSGMDAQPEVVKTAAGGTIYLVKGQSFTAGGTDWSTNDKNIAAVAKNTGKITGKGAGSTEVKNGSLTYNVVVSVPVIKVTSPSSVTNPKKLAIYTGETAQLEIGGISEENKDKYPVTWYSVNTKVAQVNDGLITAMGKGSAAITAYIGGKAYKAKVTVKDTYKAPGKIDSDEEEIEIALLQTVTLKSDSSVFKVKDSEWSGDDLKEDGGSSKTKAWKNEVVKITAAGKLTGVGEGETEIKGTDSNGKTVTLKINVKVHGAKAVYVGKGKTVTVKFPNLKGNKADWKAEDDNVAKPSNTSGKFRGEAVGSTEIRATSKEYDTAIFETTAYVEEPKFSSDSAGRLKLDSSGLKGTLELEAGEVYIIKTSGIYQDVNFKSSKKDRAFVDENGVIYARKAGNTNITAKVNGKTLKLTVTVK